jgi:hypothetical protein
MTCNIEDLQKNYDYIVKNKLTSDMKKFKNDLDNTKSKLNDNLLNYVNMCNTVLTNLGNLLTTEFPDDLIISTYVKTINGLIEKEPSDPLSTFILEVYSVDEYRRNITAGNDKFFMDTDYSANENGKKDILSFKSCWTKMSSDVKTYVKKSTQTLIKISKQYIDVKAKLDDINKMKF